MIGLCREKFKSFGDESEFRPGAYAVTCSKIEIGNCVVIRPGSFLFADPADGGGGISIEDKVLIGSSVHLYTNNHEYSRLDVPIFDQGYVKPQLSNAIILRRGCWIGANATILQGVEVGSNSVIAAGTVVTKSVPPKVIFAGNPGKVIRNIDSVKAP
jgi:acetyltransferase-like isoleucine patch superfamily enzyme